MPSPGSPSTERLVAPKKKEDEAAPADDELAAPGATAATNEVPLEGESSAKKTELLSSQLGRLSTLAASSTPTPSTATTSSMESNDAPAAAEKGRSNKDENDDGDEEGAPSAEEPKGEQLPASDQPNERKGEEEATKSETQPQEGNGGPECAVDDNSSNKTATTAPRMMTSKMGVRFVDYMDESQLDYVMSLVGRDLSEPYSSEFFFLRAAKLAPSQAQGAAHKSEASPCLGTFICRNSPAHQKRGTSSLLAYRVDPFTH